MPHLPATPARARHEFTDCSLDVAARELRRNDHIVHLQPKAFDVLVYLVGARDRVVPKDELLEKLWPGESVGETSLSFAIKAVRRAIGDDGAAQRVVRTVHGRGYRFVAEIAEDRDSAAEPMRETSSGIAIRDRILIQGAATPFVGRDDETRMLAGELEAARRGETRTVFVLGDPGVGKTRLAAEVASGAEAAGFDVAVGRCDDGSPPAFWPWVQVVRCCAERHGRDAARKLAGDGLADIARLAPGLLAEAPEPAVERVPTEAEAEHARLRLFESLVGFVRNAAATRPLLLVLDDLQWADASSLLVLRHLVRELLDSRLLVLGTYRHMEVDAGSPLADLVGWLHRTRRSSRLRLVGLADEDVSVLVRELSGAEPSGELVTALGKVTDGNPFFVEEFCRDFAASSGAETARALAAGSVRVPEQVREILERRLLRLDAGERHVLGAAAVLGREFFYADLLAAVAGEADVAGGLRAAEATGLVRADSSVPGAFVFAHALVCEVLRDSLGSIERAQIHQRVARAMEEHRGGDPLVRATALAHHYSGAVAIGEAPSAFAWELATGDLLLDRFASEDASIHYDRALALARSGACGDRELYELLLKMARASFRSGDESRVRDLVLEAVEIGRRLGSVILVARAALRTATLFPITPREQITLLEEALAGLRSDPAAPQDLLARVVSALASGLYMDAREAQRREALLDEALVIARRLGNLPTLLRVLDASHVALWRPGYLGRRLELAREHARVAETSGNLIEMGSARTWLVPALIEHGDIAEADSQIDLIDRESSRSHMLVHRANALSFRAMRALTHGAFDEVEFLAQRSFEMARRFNEATASMTLWSQIYYLRREQGRLAEIEAGVHMFASQVPQISWDWLILHLLVEDGRSAEAAPILARFVATGFAEGLPPDAHIVSSAALFGLAEAAWRLRSRQAAELLLPKLERYRGQWVTVGLGGVCLGSIAYAIGLALATLGRIDEAAAALEDSALAHERGDVSLPLLRSRVELGCVLLGRRDRASRSRARALLDSTRPEAQRLGLVQLLSVIEAAGT
jgi:DNA-binding winged helix-turn-helix (wHTH) protein/tetratricopeptide (TPR) repeat protein